MVTKRELNLSSFDKKRQEQIRLDQIRLDQIRLDQEIMNMVMTYEPFAIIAYMDDSKKPDPLEKAYNDKIEKNWGMIARVNNEEVILNEPIKNFELQTKASKGLNYNIHINKQTGEMVIAFRGSQEFFADWLRTNPKIAINGVSNQAKEALRLLVEDVKKIQKELSDKGISINKITTTGHSLGGHIASIVALSDPIFTQAVIFNSASQKDMYLYHPNEEVKKDNNDKYFVEYPYHGRGEDGRIEYKKQYLDDTLGKYYYNYRNPTETEIDKIYNFDAKTGSNIIANSKKHIGNNKIHLAGDSHRLVKVDPVWRLQNLMVQSGNFTLQESTDYLARKYEHNRLFNSTYKVAMRDLMNIYQKISAFMSVDQQRQFQLLEEGKLNKFDKIKLEQELYHKALELAKNDKIDFYGEIIKHANFVKSIGNSFVNRDKTTLNVIIKQDNNLENNCNTLK